MKPISVLYASILVIIVMTFFGDPKVNIFMIFGLLLAVVAPRRTLRPLRKYIVWMLLFAVPLYLIHGLINTEFNISNKIFGKIPIRYDGINFANEKVAFIGLLFAVAFCWIEVKRDAFVRMLKLFRVPDLILQISFQAISLISLIQIRAKSILLAQRARGIRVEGNPLVRARALSAVVIPLVVTLINEAPHRAAVQYYSQSVRTLDFVRKEPMISVGELFFLTTLFLGSVCIKVFG